MQFNDYTEIADLEEITGDFPWKVEHIKKFANLSQKTTSDPKELKGHNIYVAEAKEVIVGYMFVQLYADHYRIIKMVAHPKFGNESWAFMLQKLKGKLMPTRKRSIVICVPEHNTAYQMFLKEQKFKATEIVKNKFVRLGSTLPRDGYLFEFSPFGSKPEKDENE